MFYSLIVILALQVVSCSSEKTTIKQSQEIPDHPRIIINKHDIYQLTKNIAANDYLNRLNKVILNATDGMLLLKSRKRVQTGKRLLYVSRTYGKRILYLSYSYVITKEVKYLQKAEEEMLSASAPRSSASP